MQNYFIQPPHPPISLPHDHILYFDGSAIPNPGKGGCGFVIKNISGVTIHEEGKLVHLEGQGAVTSNQAEYAGLIEGLRKCRDLGSQVLLVRGDSELVIKQMLRFYAVTSPSLIPLNKMAQEALLGFIEVRFEVIPRELNHEADELSRKYLVQTGEENTTNNQPTNRRNNRTVRDQDRNRNRYDRGPRIKVEEDGFISTNAKRERRQQGGRGKGRDAGRSVRPQEPNNYTMQLLDAMNDDNVEFIKLLIETLSSIPENEQKQPPSIPPPHPFIKPNTKRGPRSQGLGGSQALQVRYLAIMAKCNLSEAFRAHAFQSVKHREWQEVVTAWNAAYETINMIDSDRAYAIYIASDNDNESAVDLEGHDLKQLEVLFNVMDILREDTERARGIAIDKMTVALEAILSQLTPLRMDRDAIKQRIGDERWKNNPNPKMDYAQRIIELNREKKLIEKAIASVQELILISR